MAIDMDKARSIIENMTNMTHRRSSFFEPPLCSKDEKENVIHQKLNEWNRRWEKGGAHATNEVLVYPRSYMQQIDQEKEMWTSSVNKVMDRLYERETKLDSGEVEIYPFSEEQQKRLQTIDLEIEKHSTDIKRYIELSKIQSENCIQNDEQEAELVSKLLTESLKTRVTL